ncbi:MAG: VIT domain-containing protein [bacterium]
MLTLRPFLRAPAAGVAFGLAASIPAAAGPTPPDVPGTGCLQTEVSGQLVDFPLKHTKVDADVSGPVARVLVTQTFQNPYDAPIEAVYVFPLPHDAAVCDFQMRIGERTIRGKIDRREEARRQYEEARDRGQVASLLEQQRPNVFTQSVANILPGNEIDVTITYVETLPYESGSWELAFPTVVGPRFNPPGEPVDLLPASDPPVLWRTPNSRGLENPPFLPPGVRSGHDLEIAVHWDAGIPIDRIDSPTHRIDVQTEGRTKAIVTLHPLDSVPNKDFVVRCRAKGDGPETGVTAYHDGKTGYLSVLVHPKLDLDRGDVTPKEMIFVLDCSGSMSGEPIAAAKQVVRHALTNVDPRDTFQIIRFSEGASGFASRPVPATAENVRRGLAYLDTLQGEGGTMMIEGIRAALGFPSDPSRLRIVMFLTDGYIGNEAEILSEVRARIGNARLFAFGVGSSVNRYLLDGLAQEGRGEVQYFLPGSSVTDEVAKFYGRIRNPYLTDVTLAWHGVDVEDATPSRVPDLFGGQPLCVQARYTGGGDASLEVHGKIAGRPWSKRVMLDLPRRESGNPAIGALWARARIASLEREDLHGTDAAIAEQITQLGLEHRLVTKYTSFVAVEQKLVVSNGRPQRVDVPLEMPEGVSWKGVFGEGEPLQQGTLGCAAPMSMNGPPASAQVLRTVTGFPSGGRESDRAAAPEERAKDAREDVGKIERTVEPRVDRNFERKKSPARIDLAVSVDRTALKAGQPITLTVTLRNAGGAAIDVPTTLALGDGLLRIRVIDASWTETVIGPPAGGTPRPLATATTSLAPGRTRTYTIRLTPKEAAFLSHAGVVHLYVQGGPLGAAKDSEQITIRIAS